MGKANGIYQRSDHRWEARYKKGVAPNGRAIYGSVYGATREEAAQNPPDIVDGHFTCFPMFLITRKILSQVIRHDLLRRFTDSVQHILHRFSVVDQCFL